MFCHFGVFPQLLDQNRPWEIWESFVPWAVGSVWLKYVLQQYSLDSDKYCTHCRMTVPMAFCRVAVSLILPMGWKVLCMCLGGINSSVTLFIKTIFICTILWTLNHSLIITPGLIIIMWFNLHNIKLPLLHSGIEYELGYVRHKESFTVRKKHNLSVKTQQFIT